MGLFLRSPLPPLLLLSLAFEEEAEEVMAVLVELLTTVAVAAETVVVVEVASFSGTAKEREKKLDFKNTNPHTPIPYLQRAESTQSPSRQSY